MEVRIDPEKDKVNEMFGIETGSERFTELSELVEKLWKEEVVRNSPEGVSTGQILKTSYERCENIEEVAWVTYLVAYNGGRLVESDPFSLLMRVASSMQHDD